MNDSNAAVSTAQQSQTGVEGVYDQDVAIAILKLVSRHSMYPSEIVRELRAHADPSVRIGADSGWETIKALQEQGMVRRTSFGSISRPGLIGFLKMVFIGPR